MFSKINNPFESGQIKKYLLFYAGVLLIVVLFFIASTLFRNKSIIEKKKFNTKVEHLQKKDIKNSTNDKYKFKLLKKTY